MGRARNGSLICLSRVWLQTKLGDTKSCYQLIIKITISEKKRNRQVIKERENLFKLQIWMWLVDLNYNFECDWLIELSDNKLSDHNWTTQ